MAISTATVKAFVNTGFDINNIPDSPALLQSAASQVITLDTLNCLPLSGKDSGSITVKAFSQLPIVDYMSLYFPLDGVTYYVTDINYEYISLDTVVINFTVDGWNTGGGLANISSISGITKRVHVAKADDVFGAYTEEDEMICPSKPLEIDTGVSAEHYNYRTDQIDSGITIVEATLDVAEMGEASLNFGGKKCEALYFKDENGENGVTVPMVPAITDKSTCTIPYPEHAQSQEIVDTPAVAYYLASSTNSSTDGTTGTIVTNKKIVGEGIKAARNVAAESAILAQYVIPSGYTDTDNNDDVVGKLLILKGKYAETDTAPAPAYSPSGYTVRNKKLFTGSCNSYIIQGIASGNSATFKPEEIAETENENPVIFMFTDPRPTGKPYFRFKKYLKSTATWFTNLVAGIEWQNAPITYTSASGISLKERNLKSQEIYNRGMLNLSQEYDRKNWLINSTNDFVKGAETMSPSKMIGAVSGAAFNSASTMLKHDYEDNQYAINRQKERVDFAVNNYVVAPSLAFPVNPSLRDVLGNGCYVYKYRLSDDDIKKCDRLLTMYGYRLTAPLTKSHFNNRPQFNYVEAGSVKIEYATAVSKRIRELAQQQVSSGVRVWHIRPVNLLTANNE